MAGTSQETLLNFPTGQSSSQWKLLSGSQSHAMGRPHMFLWVENGVCPCAGTSIRKQRAMPYKTQTSTQYPLFDGYILVCLFSRRPRQWRLSFRLPCITIKTEHPQKSDKHTAEEGRVFGVGGRQLVFTALFKRRNCGA